MSKVAQAWFDQSGLPAVFDEIRRRQIIRLCLWHWWEDLWFTIVLTWLRGDVCWDDPDDRTMGTIGWLADG